jgi:hypothetical protein
MTSNKPRGICPVCERSVQLLKNGTMGPHTTGRPAQSWPYRSPRCLGWLSGHKPKETKP